MSVTKNESLKSGKLNIIQVDHSSDIERQKNYNCIINSTPTKNINDNVIQDNDDLIVNCTPTKTTNNNRDTVSITDSTPSKNSSGSVASSSGDKEYCKKFFIPLEISQIYKGFTKNRIKAQEIIEYFFDSCSSGEENCESSEIKSSDLESDSNLYAYLLRLKKKTKTPWQNNFRRKTRNNSITYTRCSSAHRKNKTFVFSSDKESESVSSENILTDNSQNVSEDKIVETPQLKEKCIENKTKSNLNKLILEQFLHIEKQNTVNGSEDNIKISPEQVISVVERCETGNGETSVLENLITDTENSSVTKHSSIFDIENDSNFGTSVLENFTCDTKNSTVNESDNNINNQLLEVSSSNKLISQNSIVDEKDSDFETLFIEKTKSVNLKNCRKNCIVKNNNSKKKNSLYDVTGTELDHSDCNEENMVKSKDRRNLEGHYSKTVESLKNTDNEVKKSFSELHKEPDCSENVDSRVLKHDKQYSLSSGKNIKKSSSNPIKIYTHYSDTEQSNENKKISQDNNQNLNEASHKNNSMNQDNKFNNKERKKEDDKTVSYRNSSFEKDKQNIAATIKYNRHEEKRSVYDTSENSDSDTDKRSINKSIFSKNKDIVANSDSKNNCSDQGNSNQTSTDYVIKLSSDNDSEASDKRNTKTFKSVSFNGTVDHHVSVSSNDNNSDISDNEKRPVSTYEKIESINQIKNNLLIDFNEDFLRRNEVWLVQCPKNMNMGNIKGQSLNVPSRTVVHDHGCKYECYAHQNNTLQQTVNLAVPHKLHKFSLNVIPIAGNVIFEEKVEVPEVTSIMINAKRKLPLPDGLKVRHPLLGLDYLDQPKTSVGESSYSYKKKKKHKHRDSLPIDSNESKIQIDSKPPKKKKGKSENNPAPISNVDESDSSINYIFKLPKKNKRKKSVITSLELANSTENDVTVNDFTPRSSKKKRKRPESETPVDDTNFDETEFSSNETPTLKKKKKRKRMESETLFNGNFEETEISSNETPRLKKKRKRMESETLFDASYEESFEDEAFEDEKPKKKKKSKSRNTSFEEEADDGQLDIEKSSSKKKKKH